MIRQPPTAPEPQCVDGQFSGRAALRVERMIVQDHLRLVQQAAPTLAGIAFGQVREQIVTQHFARRRKVRQARFLRQAQVPARRVRCGNRKTFVTEQRFQRFQQGFAFFRRKAKITAGQHPHRGHVRTHMARIGTQPGELHRIAGIQLPGQRRHRQTTRQDVEAARDAGLVASIDLFPVGAGGDAVQHVAWCELIAQTCPGRQPERDVPPWCG